MYGVLQERIMDTPYGKDSEGNNVYFEDSTFLVFSNRIFAAVVAVIIVVYRGLNCNISHFSYIAQENL